MKAIKKHSNVVHCAVMQILACPCSPEDIIASKVADLVLGTQVRPAVPFLDLASASLRPLADTSTDPTLARIWEMKESFDKGCSSIIRVYPVFLS